MNCIIYLVRSSEKDVEEFNKSLSLLEENLLKYTTADVLVFVEESFEEYKSKVETNLEFFYIRHGILLNGEFGNLCVLDYPSEILDNIFQIHLSRSSHIFGKDNELGMETSCFSKLLDIDMINDG